MEDRFGLDGLEFGLHPVGVVAATWAVHANALHVGSILFDADPDGA